MRIYEQRWDFISQYVGGKRVIEVGPAELVGTVNQDKIDRWPHAKISKVASKVVGIERNAEQVRALSALGFDIREGTAEEFDLREPYDVVLAGDVIEHLSNPGKFLDCARRHLVDGGKVVLTTPNRYGIRWVLQVLKTGEHPPYTKPIAKHVLYFDADALSSLLERHGFKNIEISYCKWVGAASERQGVKMLIDGTAMMRPAMLPVLMAVAEK